MSSVVQHRALRPVVKAPSVSGVGTDLQGEPSTGLLASRAFWLGGLGSVAVWTVVVFALVRAF